jgi:hypothetical protein
MVPQAEQAKKRLAMITSRQSNRRFRRRRGAERTRPRPKRLGLESLETRALLSVTLGEVEPNDTMATAQQIPLGLDPGEFDKLTVQGDVEAKPEADHDWYQFYLNAGDVIGVRVQGQGQLDPTASLHAPDGTLLMFNDNHRYAAHNYNTPNESPLSGFNSWNSEDSILRYVVSASGDYSVQVAAAENASVGNYRLELIVARPGLESEPEGTQQILFVDFDGATINMSEGKIFGGFGGTGKSILSPMRDFLPYWGFTADQEDALVDVVLATLEENFQDAFAEGNNPDAGLVILNSRDHADQFGVNPYVARVIIGGTLAETDLEGRPFPIFAFAQHVDTGNFDFDDTAVVLLDELSGMVPGVFNYMYDLNQFGIHPSSSKIEMVGTALGNIASHELGHNFGSYHSRDNAETGTIMGRGTAWGFDLPGAGPDGIFGNRDDVDKHFGVDTFSQTEPFEGVGVNDALNNTAFGLTTGQAPLEQAAASWAVAVDLLMADQPSERTTSSSTSGLAELTTLYGNDDR